MSLFNLFSLITLIKMLLLLLLFFFHRGHTSFQNLIFIALVSTIVCGSITQWLRAWILKPYYQSYFRQDSQSFHPFPHIWNGDSSCTFLKTKYVTPLPNLEHGKHLINRGECLWDNMIHKIFISLFSLKEM